MGYSYKRSSSVENTSPPAYCFIPLLMPLDVCLCCSPGWWFQGFFHNNSPKLLAMLGCFTQEWTSAILPPGNLCWGVRRNRENVLVKVLCENTALSEGNRWRVYNDSELWKDIWGQWIKRHHFSHLFWEKQNSRKLFPLFLSLWNHSKAEIATAECTPVLLEVLFGGVWFWGSLEVNSQDSRDHPLICQIGATTQSVTSVPVFNLLRL